MQDLLPGVNPRVRTSHHAVTGRNTKGPLPMKKIAKKGAFRPVRSKTPVISVRTPAALYERITARAAESGATLSETIAGLLERGFRCEDYDDAFGEAAEIIRRAREQARVISAGFGFNKSGFPDQGDGPSPDPEPPAERPPLTDADHARIKAVMAEFEARIAAALQPKKGAA